MQGNSIDLFGDSSEPTKRCNKCGKTFPIHHFHYRKDIHYRKSRHNHCKHCKAQASREWNAKYATTKALNRNLVKAYGLTLKDYQAMLIAQDNRCAICGGLPEKTNHINQRLHVDHCHVCGEIRFLLCATCNNGLGCFKDDPQLLEKALLYLKSHNHKVTKD